MTNLVFGTVATGGTFALTINLGRIDKITDNHGNITKLEGLKWSLKSIVNQWPDLADKHPAEIKAIGLERFKTHLKSFKTEREMIIYLKEDLVQHGHKLLFIQKPGHRPLPISKINWLKQDKNG